MDKLMKSDNKTLALTGWLVGWLVGWCDLKQIAVVRAEKRGGAWAVVVIVVMVMLVVVMLVVVMLVVVMVVLVCVCV
jgi:hypothetical protein